VGANLLSYTKPAIQEEAALPIEVVRFSLGGASPFVSSLVVPVP
jgi:hypothetical protein